MLLCLVLVIIIAVQAVKIYIMKKSAKEIRMQLIEKLTLDTNTIIGISSSDKDMRALASALNEQLKVLRAEHIRYSQGDLELKTAVTNISHDLRTPLTAICGYLDFLKSEEKSVQAENYLAIIEERTEALKQLTDELLKYSSAVSDEQNIQFDDAAVNNILEKSILSYRAALQERGIIPEILITDKKIIRSVNRSALSRVFANLLNNALKYSDGDLCVTMNDDGIITFRNHAKSLDSLQVGKLFDRFYTVECGGQSSGLGLSIARVLTEQMGGSISAEYHDEVLEIFLSL